MSDSNPSSAHILVVDDHREIRDAMQDYLSAHGYRVSTADGGPSMRKTLAGSAIDLIVLDIMMPGEDGLTLCRELRAKGDIPIILLTAVAEDTDRIVGLEMGADDYVTKPFNPRELLARIKVVLRRTHTLPPRSREPGGNADRVHFAGWTLDLKSRALTGQDGAEVALSTGEYRLLAILVTHANRVLSRDQLLDLTQGRAARLFDRSIDNQVSRLRKKLEPGEGPPKLIKTVRGGGYMFTATVEHG
ncbi:MAG: response regulator [Pseudomonadota bacterium]